MDSVRDRSDYPQPPSGPIVGGNHQPTNPTPLSNATSSASEPEANWCSTQSTDYQGRPSLRQPRPSPGPGNSFTVGSASPRIYPIRSSVHSGLSAENGLSLCSFSLHVCLLILTMTNINFYFVIYHMN
jgi:hypothetical protein